MAMECQTPTFMQEGQPMASMLDLIWFVIAPEPRARYRQPRQRARERHRGSVRSQGTTARLHNSAPLQPMNDSATQLHIRQEDILSVQAMPISCNIQQSEPNLSRGLDLL